MKEKNNYAYTVVLIIFLLIQALFIFLNFAYAFLGEYKANKPSNFWATVWTGKVAFGWLLSNVFSVSLGIIGLISAKKNKVQILAAVILLLSIGVSGISMIYALGAHF